MAALTRFGSSTASPHSAAGVLRALASRHGLPLVHVDTVATAAAVIAVETWMEALDASSLESTGRFGSSTTPALAAALRLAATGEVPDAVMHEELAELDRFAPLLERIHHWLTTWLPTRDDRVDAVLFAAACLSVAPDPRLGSLAELLDTWTTEI